MAIQILRGPEELNPLESTHTLSDGQLFYSKNNKQLYVGDGDSPISDLLPITSYLYSDPAGEESISQLSHNAVNTEGGENTLNPLQVNITTGRSSFTNGQKNRNGGYFSIQTGQANTQPRLFDMTFPDGSVVKKWRSASSNIVGGLGNFVTSANSVVSGYTNQSAGSLSVISGRNNKDWVEGATPEESEKTQNSITAYKNYSLYGANENTGEIYDKNGAGTDAYLQDIQFNPIQTFTIMNGLANNNRSIYSIMNGSGNKNFANTSIIVGKNNNANTTDYSYDAGSKCHFIFGSSNTTQGSNIYSLGNSNTLSGNNIIALGRDCISSDFNNVILMNGATATRSNQVVIGGSSPADWAKFSIGGGSSTATAFQVSDANYVYVTRKPIDDDNPVRLVDIKNGELSAKFSSLYSNGSSVITINNLTSETALKTYTPTFSGLQLRRSSNETRPDTFSALRLSDISTGYEGTVLNLGAGYQALDVKFASIKMKATAGNDGGTQNTGIGSTVILPDKITTNELDVKNITGNIESLNTDSKNIVSAINELDEEIAQGDTNTLDSAKEYTNDKLNALDYSASGDVLKTITNISQTNGLVSVVYDSINTYSKSRIDSDIEYARIHPGLDSDVFTIESGTLYMDIRTQTATVGDWFNISKMYNIFELLIARVIAPNGKLKIKSLSDYHTGGIVELENSLGQIYKGVVSSWNGNIPEIWFKCPVYVV